jgi:cytochrome P450
VSRFALAARPFVDENRTFIAKDPRDYWRELQAGGVFVDTGGYYYVTRRKDVLAALRDHTTFASRRKPLPPSANGVKSLPIPVPLGYDPPQHTRLPPHSAALLQPACGG